MAQHLHNYFNIHVCVSNLKAGMLLSISTITLPISVVIHTQGVLDSKFPISIRTQTQGQYRCQNVQTILKNHVPVSDFATMQLNLKKNSKIGKIFAKKKKFFLQNFSDF